MGERMDQRWLRGGQQDVGEGQEGDTSFLAEKSESTREGRWRLQATLCRTGDSRDWKRSDFWESPAELKCIPKGRGAGGLGIYPLLYFWNRFIWPNFSIFSSWQYFIIIEKHKYPWSLVSWHIKSKAMHSLLPVIPPLRATLLSHLFLDLEVLGRLAIL